MRFRPAVFEPTFHKHAKASCGGCQIHVLDRAAFSAGRDRRRADRRVSRRRSGSVRMARPAVRVRAREAADRHPRRIVRAATSRSMQARRRATSRGRGNRRWRRSKGSEPSFSPIELVKRRLGSAARGPNTCCSANRSTARETAAPGDGHSAGQVRDLAWTRPCAGGFPSVACDAPLARFAAAARVRPCMCRRIAPADSEMVLCDALFLIRRALRREGVIERGWGPASSKKSLLSPGQRERIARQDLRACAGGVAAARRAHGSVAPRDAANTRAALPPNTSAFVALT